MLKLKMISRKKIITVVVALVIAYVIASRLFTYASGLWECRLDWSESGMEYKFKFGAGCMISPNGNWVPARNYRID